MANFRSLTDGTTTLLALDLVGGRVRPGTVPTGKPIWQFGYVETTITTKTTGARVRLYPTLVLIDGQAKVAAQLVLLSPVAWETMLRNSLIPFFEEEGRRIDFPRLPDLPLPPST